MYYIGIDISKFKHDCAVIDDVGDVVTPSWSFANDHEGFLQFKALLDSLGSETRIGLESTGHYGTNLKLFLESCSTTFMEFNPLLINRFTSFRFTSLCFISDIFPALIIVWFLRCKGCVLVRLVVKILLFV